MELSTHNEPTITLTFVAQSQHSESLTALQSAIIERNPDLRNDFKKNIDGMKGTIVTIKTHCDTIGYVEYATHYPKIMESITRYEVLGNKLFDLINESKNEEEFYKKYQAGSDSIFRKILQTEILPIYAEWYGVVYEPFGTYSGKKETNAAELKSITSKVVTVISTIFIVSLILSLIFWFNISSYLSRSIDAIISHLKAISQGKLFTAEIKSKDEVAEILYASNQLTDNLNKASNFATDIGKGNFDNPYQPAGQEDTLGHALVSMRNELKKFKLEDEKRFWVNQGFAKFGDILRVNNHSLELLGDKFIAEMVKYLGANQAALFVANKDTEPHTLEIIACYAYERKKYMHLQIEAGEGLTGQAYLEKEAIYLTDVPDNYIKITSGLGASLPKCVLIVPVKSDDHVLGILELASFDLFEEYQIEFVKKVCESLASILITVKNNEVTNKLVSQLQNNTLEMQSREEELRQNMEELVATQEEMRRKENEYLNIPKKKGSESMSS